MSPDEDASPPGPERTQKDPANPKAPAPAAESSEPEARVGQAPAEGSRSAWPRRIGFALLALVVLAAASAGAGLYVWKRALEPVDPSGTPIVYVVEPGASVRRVARDLEAAGLLHSQWVLVALARLRALEGSLKIGEYEVSSAWGAERILERLVSGEVVTYPVVLPEGLTAVEIAARLDEAGLVDGEVFLALARNPDSADAMGVEGPGLEGYLFPDTYRLPHGLSAQQVARVLVAQFLNVWSEIEAGAAERKLSMRQVATLASIVEKETGAAEERPLIASVFHNRMKRGMRLESDPTTIYGIPDFDGNLRRVHLEDGSNPYNTYKIPGLPPGPIANPGAHALRAVVSPAESEFLFFVSRNDGTHSFSRTYAEHSAKVDQYQRRRRRR